MIGVFKGQRKFRNKGFSNWDFSIVILLGSRDCRLSESLVWIKVPTVQQERIDIEFVMVFRRIGELLKLRCHLTLIRISGMESLKQDLRSWRPQVAESKNRRKRRQTNGKEWHGHRLCRMPVKRRLWRMRQASF